ncbi:craniofacial development protein 2-like [Montipora foliosa]|uniref:craniofacial development protein 2-like n=1 Tax=Montipora foliosa TaxID=591990 RepID=UPI0035F1A087
MVLTRHDPPASVGAWSLKLINSTYGSLNPAPGKYSKNETKTPILRIASWNLALQETRLPDSGSLKEENYTFFWQGKSSEGASEHGVGFAVKNTLLCMIQVPYNGTARILTLRPSKEEGTVRLVCVYAPTLQSPPEVKDQFYESLDTVIGMVPSSDHILLLGDFNARVGADRESWPSVLGHHGIGKMNDNDQTLLELCCYHNLCETNTFFQNKAYHKVSWRHPRSKHWHQPDLVITRCASLNNVCNTRSYHSADCNIDHSLVYYSKKKGQPRINTSKTAYSDKIQKFAESLEESLMYHHEQSAEDRWSSLRTWQESTNYWLQLSERILQASLTGNIRESGTSMRASSKQQASQSRKLRP